MRISKILSSQLSFGTVKKLAREKAESMAKGNHKQLQRINEIVKEQKKNIKFDVVIIPKSLRNEHGNIFAVVRHGNCYSPANCIDSFPDLESAAKHATQMINAGAITD